MCRTHFACHRLFGKRAATGKSARSAVGVGQHLSDGVDPRVFPDPQTLVGKRDEDAEYQSDAAKNQDSVQGIRHMAS